MPAPAAQPKLRVLLLAACALLALRVPANAQQVDPLFDATLVTVNVDGFANTEVMGLVWNGKILLATDELFGFLKLRADKSASGDSLTGYINQPSASFRLAPQQHVLAWGKETRSLREDELILYDGHFFLECSWFGTAFQLNCTTNLRALSVLLQPGIELPAVKELRLAQLRRNVQKLTRTEVADTQYRLHNGVAGLNHMVWSVNLRLGTDGIFTQRSRMRFGGHLLGGEADLSAALDNQKVSLDNARWRWVDNGNPYLRQVTAGRLALNTTTPLERPVLGIQLSNTPSGFRKAFGRTRVVEQVPPGWTVELHINGMLVDYAKADASGTVNFEIPLVYGSSHVVMRYFGPNGEEEVREKRISIPYSFVPPGELEYSLSAGVTETLIGRQRYPFGKLQVNYGLSSRITLGLTDEYAPSIPGRHLPAVQAVARPANGMLLQASYAPGIRLTTQASFTPRRKRWQMDLAVDRPDPGQLVLRSTLAEERLTFNTPFLKKWNGFFKAGGAHTKAGATSLLRFDGSVTVQYRRVSLGYQAQAQMTGYPRPMLSSCISAGTLVGRSLRVRSNLQYDGAANQVTNVRSELDWRPAAGKSLSFSCDYNLRTRQAAVNLGLQIRFGFSNASMNLTGGATPSLNANFGGGADYYAYGRKLNWSAQSSLGTATLTVITYADMNGNNRPDPGEPRVRGLRVSGAGAAQHFDPRDTSLQISELEGFNSYLLQFDIGGVENIYLTLRHKTAAVRAVPNSENIVYVGLQVVGEISGQVFRKEARGKRPLAQMAVLIFDEHDNMVARVVTDKEGAYQYFGAKSGTYYLRPDPKQLSALGLKLDGAERTIRLNNGSEGDAVTDADLLLIPDSGK